MCDSEKKFPLCFLFLIITFFLLLCVGAKTYRHESVSGEWGPWIGLLAKAFSVNGKMIKKMWEET